LSDGVKTSEGHFSMVKTTCATGKITSGWKDSKMVDNCCWWFVFGNRSVDVSRVLKEAALMKLHLNWASVMEGSGTRMA